MNNVPAPIPGKGEVRNWENGIECPVSTEKGTLFQIKKTVQIHWVLGSLIHGRLHAMD